MLIPVIDFLFNLNICKDLDSVRRIIFYGQLEISSKLVTISAGESLNALTVNINLGNKIKCGNRIFYMGVNEMRMLTPSYGIVSQ